MAEHHEYRFASHVVVIMTINCNNYIVLLGEIGLTNEGIHRIIDGTETQSSVQVDNKFTTKELANGNQGHH